MTTVEHTTETQSVVERRRTMSVLERFARDGRAVGWSERYIQSITETVRMCAALAGTDPQFLNEDDCLDFLARELSNNSKHTYHTQLTAFCRWNAKKNGGIDCMVDIRKPRKPRGMPRPVADQHFAALLSTRMHFKTRVMIELAAYQGLRVHEIAKLRGEDVDPIAKTLTVVGKGAHRAVVPLHPVLLHRAAEMPPAGLWFPANSKLPPGEHVRPRSVSDVIGRTMKRAGVPGTPHGLRHWFGTTLVENDVDLRTVQMLMRHSSLQQTEVYVLASPKRQARAIERLDVPGTDWKQIKPSRTRNVKPIAQQEK